MNSMIHKGLLVLKDKIQNTPLEKLDALKQSIALSDLHPQVKEACFFDIEQRVMNRQEALVTLGDRIWLD